VQCEKLRHAYIPGMPDIILPDIIQMPVCCLTDKGSRSIDQIPSQQQGPQVVCPRVCTPNEEGNRNFEVFLAQKIAQLQRELLDEYEKETGRTALRNTSKSEVGHYGKTQRERKPKSPLTLCQNVGTQTPVRRTSVLDGSNDSQQMQSFAASADLVDVEMNSLPLSPRDQSSRKDKQIRKASGESAQDRQTRRQQKCEEQDSTGDLELEGQESTVKPSRSQRMKQIVLSDEFDQVFAVLIMLNIVCLIAETQYLGMQAGISVGAGYRVWDEGKTVFLVLEYIFIGIFTVEICVKLGLLRSTFFATKWNWLDFAIVALAWLSLITAAWNFDAARLRIFRLGRVIRMLRLAKVVQKFESFIIILRSVRASSGALIWTFVFLLAVISIASVGFCQVLVPFIKNDANDLKKRVEVYDRFGTWSRSCVTVFEMTVGNWGPPCWLLVNSVSEWFTVAVLIYKLSAGFALLNVVNAVFLRQTMKVADKLDDFTIDQKKREADGYLAKVAALFDEVDTSGDGQVSYDEFLQVLGCGHMKAWMSLLKVEVHEVEELFKLLDDGDGFLQRDEFVHGIQRMQGGATAIDCVSLLSAVAKVDKKVEQVCCKLGIQGSSLHFDKVSARLLTRRCLK